MQLLYFGITNEIKIKINLNLKKRHVNFNEIFRWYLSWSTENILLNGCVYPIIWYTIQTTLVPNLSHFQKPNDQDVRLNQIEIVLILNERRQARQLAKIVLSKSLVLIKFPGCCNTNPRLTQNKKIYRYNNGMKGTIK